VSTITATADNAKSQVRLDLDFSDIDAPYAYVTRVDALTGAPTAVRGHGSSATISGLPYVPMQAGYKAVLYDTEMPLDQAFYYVATAPSVTLNATSTFGGGYNDPWWPTSSTVLARPGATRAGLTYLQIVADGAATPAVRGENIPATPGATFTLTASLLISVAQNVVLGFNFRDASGAILSSPTSTVAVTTSQATYTLASGAAPANTVTVQPFFQLSGTPAAGVFLQIFSAAVTNAAGSATSGGITVQSLGACWLKDPLRPGNNVRVDFSFDPNPACAPTQGVFFQSMAEESRAANAATFNVNNQSLAQVTAKTRSSVASTLTLVSRTLSDRDRLNVALHPGSPLLFQVPAEYGVPPRYLAVGATTVSRVLPDHRFPIRVFQLPFSSCAAPGGPMQGTVGARWQDICKTWATVNTAGLTWIQVLDGAAA
jgi:hypothetical protein